MNARIMVAAAAVVALLGVEGAIVTHAQWADSRSPAPPHILSPAVPAGCFSQVTVPNPSAANSLNAISVYSATDAWAVGSGQLAEHWDGSAWSAVSLPPPPAGVGSYTGVSMIAPSDVWAVGTYNGQAGSMSAHWDGSAWTAVPVPQPAPGGLNYLGGVKAVSHNDVWAVGYSSNGGGIDFTVALHWTGSAWTRVASPSPGTTLNNLEAVDARATNDVWAVGEYNASTFSENPLTLHWDGSAWNYISAPSPGNFDLLHGVSIASATDVWAVGETSVGGVRPATYHWTGSTWTQVAVPLLGQNGRLYGVKAIGNDVYAAGTYYNGALLGLALGFDGTAWTQIPASSPGPNTYFFAIDAVPGVTNEWIAGSYQDVNNSSFALIERGCGPNTPTATATADTGATQTAVASQTSVAATLTAGAGATQTAQAGGTSVAATLTAGAGATQTAQTGATGTSVVATLTAGAGATQTAQAGGTSVAATLTAGVGATQTAAASQTAGAATATAGTGATQTAQAGGTSVAATQTAIAGQGGATQTAIANATATAGAGATQTAQAGATGTSVAATLTAGAGATQTAQAGATGTSVAATLTAGAGATQTAQAGGTSVAATLTAGIGATGTSVSASQTAIGTLPTLTQTAIANLTGTALAGTITAVAGTQTAVAQTQTAIAGITQTAIVITQTPTATATACPIRFTDVPTDNPFYSFVRCLACHGIINGYSDGTFRPYNNVTRGQIAKFIANSAGATITTFNTVVPPGTQTFADVLPGDTFYVYIEQLAQNGNVISGYDCGTRPDEPCDSRNRAYFRASNNATRGQIAKIVSNAEGFTDTHTDVIFADVPTSNPFYPYIERIGSRGIISGYDCGGFGEPCDSQSRAYFRPGNLVLRGQTAKIVGGTFFPNCAPRRAQP